MNSWKDRRDKGQAGSFIAAIPGPWPRRIPSYLPRSHLLPVMLPPEEPVTSHMVKHWGLASLAQAPGENSDHVLVLHPRSHVPGSNPTKWDLGGKSSSVSQCLSLPGTYTGLPRKPLTATEVVFCYLPPGVSWGFLKGQIMVSNFRLS